MITPARTKAHPAVVAAAVLLVVVVCGAGALQLLSQVGYGVVERTSVLTSAAQRLLVDSESGDVTLAPSTDGQVHVRTTVRHWQLGEPEIVAESAPPGVRLDAECNASIFGGCDVQHAVELPPSFEVVVQGSIGDVTASGLTGPLTVDRSAGDVEVLGLAGPLDLRTGTGGITGRGLRTETVRAVTETGDVRLTLLTAPRSLEVGSATGDVELAVPGDVSYQVDARSGIGEEQVLVPVDPASPRAVDIDSDTGDVRLRHSR